MKSRLEQPPVIELVYPFERSELHRLEILQRSARPDDLGFEQPNDRFGERVVVGVAGAPHRTIDASIDESLGVPDAQVLGAAVAMVDQSVFHLSGPQRLLECIEGPNISQIV